MKYAFVTLSIVAVWLAVILVVLALDTKGVFLPLTALIMTVALFMIGFVRRR
ncbi:MAG: hypothetical protein LBL84_02935 [Candidatus Nomurabacteria bacterium]|jgi:hypothetical protein|nr:hypothetical protein [Candidatus Nomurabacteria bacterium]